MIRVFNQYVSVKSLLLVFVEDLFIILSLISAAWLRFWGDPTAFQTYLALPGFAVQAILVLATFKAAFYYGGLYDLSAIRRQYEFAILLAHAAGGASLALGIVYWIFPKLLIGRGVFFITVTLLITFILLNRAILDCAWRVAGIREQVLILGDGALAATAAREIARRRDLNWNLLGFIGSTSDNSPVSDKPMLGILPDLDKVAAKCKVHRIIVALEDQRGHLPIRELVRLRVQGVRIEDAHSTISALTGRVWLHTIKPSWFVFADGFRRAPSVLVMKRLFDIVCSSIGLLFSLPILALVAVAIRLESKGPIIYKQERVGLGGRSFHVLKLRSMRTDAETGTGAQWARRDDPRVTVVGKYIRKWRLDELPQFINVLRGDMSFVGPRPERPVFVEMLRNEISYYDERHYVRPGLTGWAQVQYPYGASIEDAFRKLEYDLFYLKNMSLSFDVAIILQTVRTVCTGNGAR